MNTFQCFEIILLSYLDLILTEFINLFPAKSKIAMKQLLFLIIQNFLCLTEIILYRIDSSLRSNVSFIFLNSFIEMGNAINKYSCYKEIERSESRYFAISNLKIMFENYQRTKQDNDRHLYK